MSVEFIRVDDRLIHGQVVTGWTRSRGINTILAIDDATAKNKMQCQLMKMATPPGVTSVFLTVEEGAEKIMNDTYKNKKVMILVKGPKELAALIEKGVPMKEVNIGNLRSGENKIQLATQMFASKEEIEIWKDISNKGIKLYAQSVPGSTNANINEVLLKY